MVNQCTRFMFHKQELESSWIIYAAQQIIPSDAAYVAKNRPGGRECLCTKIRAGSIGGVAPEFSRWAAISAVLPAHRFA